jgi:hypothetical protein
LLTLLFLLSAGNPIPTATAGEPEDVSILQLIAASQAFDGKLVRVVGFLHLEFEDNELYFHKEDYDHAIYFNGIWIDLPRDKMQANKSLNLNYVLVTGTFDSANRGHNGLSSGSITKVQNVEIWSKRSPGK